MLYGVFENGLPFVSFGKGNKNLIILPGIIDTISSVTSWRWFWPWYFYRYLSDYKVYIIGMKKSLPLHYDINHMAFDYASVIKKIPLAHIIGIDIGSLVALELAASFPHYTNKIVIYPSFTENIDASQTFDLWIEMAQQDAWKSVYKEIFCHSYFPVIEKINSLFSIPQYSNDFIVVMKNIQKQNSNFSKIKTETLAIRYSSNKSNTTFFDKIEKCNEIFIEQTKENSLTKNIIDHNILFFLRSH